MDALTKKILAEAGFQSGSVGELLGLSEAEELLVETKVRLTALLREERRERGWSQNRLAQAMGKKQQVVARMEMAHRSVTLDLLMRALFALGVKPRRIAREIEKCEEHIGEGKRNVVGSLVEIGAIPNLIRRELVASHNLISDAKPLMRLVRDVTHLEEVTSSSRQTSTRDADDSDRLSKVA